MKSIRAKMVNGKKDEEKKPHPVAPSPSLLHLSRARLSQHPAQLPYLYADTSRQLRDPQQVTENEYKPIYNHD